MKFVVLQIIGMALVVVGGQGSFRLLVDHDNVGVLGQLSGEPSFPVALCGYIAAAVVGLLLAGWAHNRAEALGHVE
ncbi:hypothetical protein [Embleya sp. AB8]|uniref:hypothetical protein n=1 Tax=Embleya sp. AB8 TaxID=3156304 RepID=UPI003C7729F4